MPPASLLHLTERSDELFFTYDLASRRFTYMNRAFICCFNLDTEDLDPRVLLAMVHEDDLGYVQEKLDACIAGEVVKNVECRIIIDREEQSLTITPFLYTENGERLILGQAENTTVIRENREIVNRHNNKKNSILNILTHDLAGPIGVIQNLSVLLGRETVHLENPKIDRYIDMITSISKSNISLIHDFLDQEFLESVGVRLLKKRVELVDKVKTAAKQYLEMQKELNIRFSCHADREAIYVEIDEAKFMQVINNLISNALKFTPDRGTITLNVKEKADGVLITLADSGIGIPEKYHATLFDKFSDARRSGLKGEHSTGLGMSIIKTIVEWHKGKIWFESKEGKGTTFFIQLPKITV